MEAVGEIAGAAVLIFGRFMVVVHSQPSWNVAASRGSIGGLNGNWLSAEEELIVTGLVL